MLILRTIWAVVFFIHTTSVVEAQYPSINSTFDAFQSLNSMLDWDGITYVDTKNLSGRAELTTLEVIPSEIEKESNTSSGTTEEVTESSTKTNNEDYKYASTAANTNIHIESTTSFISTDGPKEAVTKLLTDGFKSNDVINDTSTSGTLAVIENVDPSMATNSSEQFPKGAQNLFEKEKENNENDDKGNQDPFFIDIEPEDYDSSLFESNDPTEEYLFTSDYTEGTTTYTSVHPESSTEKIYRVTPMDNLKIVTEISVVEFINGERVERKLSKEEALSLSTNKRPNSKLKNNLLPEYKPSTGPLEATDDLIATETGTNDNSQFVIPSSLEKIDDLTTTTTISSSVTPSTSTQLFNTKLYSTQDTTLVEQPDVTSSTEMKSEISPAKIATTTFTEDSTHSTKEETNPDSTEHINAMVSTDLNEFRSMEVSTPKSTIGISSRGGFTTDLPQDSEENTSVLSKETDFTTTTSTNRPFTEDKTAQNYEENSSTVSTDITTNLVSNTSTQESDDTETDDIDIILAIDSTEETSTPFLQSSEETSSTVSITTNMVNTGTSRRVDSEESTTTATASTTRQTHPVSTIEETTSTSGTNLKDITDSGEISTTVSASTNEVFTSVTSNTVQNNEKTSTTIPTSNFESSTLSTNLESVTDTEGISTTVSTSTNEVITTVKSSTVENIEETSTTIPTTTLKSSTVSANLEDITDTISGEIGTTVSTSANGVISITSSTVQNNDETTNVVNTGTSRRVDSEESTATATASTTRQTHPVSTIKETTSNSGTNLKDITDSGEISTTVSASTNEVFTTIIPTSSFASNTFETTREKSTQMTEETSTIVSTSTSGLISTSSVLEDITTNFSNEKSEETSTSTTGLITSSATGILEDTEASTHISEETSTDVPLSTTVSTTATGIISTSGISEDITKETRNEMSEETSIVLPTSTIISTSSTEHLITEIITESIASSGITILGHISEGKSVETIDDASTIASTSTTEKIESLGTDTLDNVREKLNIVSTMSIPTGTTEESTSSASSTLEDSTKEIRNQVTEVSTSTDSGTSIIEYITKELSTEESSTISESSTEFLEIATESITSTETTNLGHITEDKTSDSTNTMASTTTTEKTTTLEVSTKELNMEETTTISTSTTEENIGTLEGSSKEIGIQMREEISTVIPVMSTEHFLPEIITESIASSGTSILGDITEGKTASTSTIASIETYEMTNEAQSSEETIHFTTLSSSAEGSTDSAATSTIISSSATEISTEDIFSTPSVGTEDKKVVTSESTIILSTLSSIETVTDRSNEGITEELLSSTSEDNLDFTTTIPTAQFTSTMEESTTDVYVTTSEDYSAEASSVTSMEATGNITDANVSTDERNTTASIVLATEKIGTVYSEEVVSNTTQNVMVTTKSTSEGSAVTAVNTHGDIITGAYSSEVEITVMNTVGNDFTTPTYLSHGLDVKTSTERLNTSVNILDDRTDEETSSTDVISTTLVRDDHGVYRINITEQQHSPETVSPSDFQASTAPVLSIATIEKDFSYASPYVQTTQETVSEATTVLTEKFPEEKSKLELLREELLKNISEVFPGVDINKPFSDDNSTKFELLADRLFLEIARLAKDLSSDNKDDVNTTKSQNDLIEAITEKLKEMENISMETQPMQPEEINVDISEEGSIRTDESKENFVENKIEENTEKPKTAISKTEDVPYIKARVFENNANFSVKIVDEDTVFYIPSSASVHQNLDYPLLNITWASTNKSWNNSLSLNLTQISRYYLINGVQLTIAKDNEVSVWKKNVVILPKTADLLGDEGCVIEMVDGVQISISNIDFLGLAAVSVEEGNEIQTDDSSSAEMKKNRVYHIEIATGCIAAAVILGACIYLIVMKARQRANKKEIVLQQHVAA